MINNSNIIFLYGNASMWDTTQTYILNKLKELNNPDLIISLYEKIPIKYSGRIIAYNLVLTEEKVEISKKGIIASLEWEETVHDHVLKEMCNVHNLTYNDVIKMRIDYINNIKLLSYNFTSDGRLWKNISNKQDESIKEMNAKSKRLLFTSLFGKQVQEFSYFDLSDLEFNDNDNVCLIPSVININPQNTKNIGVYNSLERLQQTMKQLKSIRDNKGRSILLETSDVDLFQLSQLVKYADKVCLFYNNDEIYKLAFEHVNKNKTEIALLLKVLPFFENVSLCRIFKFGGRYSMTSSFDFNNFSNEFISGKVMKSLKESNDQFNTMEPVIYSVPKQCINEFIKICKDIFNELEVRLKTVNGKCCYASQQDIDNGDYITMQGDVEHALYLCLNKFNIKIHDVNPLHIYGSSTITGIYKYL